MTTSTPVPASKSGLHPRNLHRQAYDFPALIASHPALAAFVRPNPFGALSVDFADPAAVQTLNAALLAHFYGVSEWTLPTGYLCPPIPGRADYIHQIADLLAEANQGRIPQGDGICGLDVGCGANAIYPLLGRAIHGWRFIATEIDAVAARNAEQIFAANSVLQGGLEVRLQTRADDVLSMAINSDERIDFTLCNPPFHASAEAAAAGSQRKLRNLGLAREGAPRLNFAGRAHELWCEGGEREFLRRMIVQSEPLAGHILWFSSLVSKPENLPPAQAWLEQAGARSVRILEMSQGQKRSRILAWSYQSLAGQTQWAQRYWGL